MPPAKKYPKSVRKKGALRSIAREHAEAASLQPTSYWNDVCDIQWGDQSKYEVMQQLGKGKYGEVFEGVDTQTNSRCVIKIMRPVKEQRLKREIKILRHVSGGPNIIQMLEVVRDPGGAGCDCRACHALRCGVGRNGAAGRAGQRQHRPPCAGRG